MKKLIRITAISLCLFTIITLMGACGKKNDEAASSESGLSTADVNFVVDGAAAYRIVRPDNLDNGGALSSAVYKAFKDKLGATAKHDSDTSWTDEAAEILIGNTNREASSVAFELLLQNSTNRYDEFMICTIGDDIAIVGMTPTATEKAVDYFIENYMNSETVSGGINYVHNTSRNYSDVAIFGNTNLYGISIVRPIYNVSYVTQIQTDKLIELFKTKTGYELYEANDQTASTTGNSTDGSGTLTQNTPAKYEIIIGNCVRDGVKNISDYNEYEIRIEESKIFLNGGSPYATALAVSEFAKLIESGTSITPELTVTAGNYATDVKGYDTASYYTPTWKEDFDRDSVDTKTWSLNLDVASGYANGDKSTYRGSSLLKNNYIQDGKFYINGVTDDKGYYGGLIDTHEKFCYKYGYIELSCIKPKGNGFWTSLWTNSYSSGNLGPENVKELTYFSETDVEECYGEGGNWVYGNTYAWPTQYGKDSGIVVVPDGKIGHIHINNKKNCDDDRGYWMDFHTFGFEWNEDYTVAFTVDGKPWVEWQLREGPERVAYSYPVYLKLSMACGTSGKFPTDEYEQKNTNKYITEYVHIYQTKGQKTYYKNSSSSSWTTVTVQ